MNKSKKKTTSIMDRIKEYSNIYDGVVIHDPVSNTFKTENQFKYEEKIKEKKLTNKKIKKSIPTPKVPFKLDVKLDHLLLNIDSPLKENNILNELEQDREKTDPDFFKGLGTFLHKKI